MENYLIFLNYSQISLFSLEDTPDWSIVPMN